MQREAFMKKIVYLMEYPLDLPGGGQMSTETLCAGLLEYKTEWEPVVICPRLLNKKAADYPFEVMEYEALENREDALLTRLYNFIRRIGSFKKLIKKASPELIHVSMSESLLTYGFIRWLPSLKRIPFVYTDRGLCYGYRSHTKFLMRRILKHSSGMICTTGFNKGLWAKEELGIPITVIPNTINKIFSVYDEDKRAMMRERFGLTGEELVIGFAGRISEEKDWPFVPVLVSSLKEAGISFKVALVISVYEDKDLKQVEDIKRGIITAIGEENLIYMQDLSQSEISDYYYMVDIFVMSSMFESFGKAAVEAMSRKCVLVSTSAGGLKEVIGKEENLYTKETVGRFVERVRRLSEDKEELAHDREFFYHRYLDNYTLEKHIERHADLYDSL